MNLFEATITMGPSLTNSPIVRTVELNSEQSVRLDMSEKHKMTMEVTQKGGCAEVQDEAYLFAVGVLRDVLLRLKAVGVAPNEQCDALGYTLINLLTDHYSEEHALLSFERLQSTLKLCYEAGLGPSPKNTTSVSQH